MKSNTETETRLNKEQKNKQKDFEKRQLEMVAEIRKLSAKYRIDIRGTLDYTADGVIPLVAFVDVKDKYEQVVKEDTGIIV